MNPLVKITYYLNTEQQERCKEALLKWPEWATEELRRRIPSSGKGTAFRTIHSKTIFVNFYLIKDKMVFLGKECAQAEAFRLEFAQGILGFGVNPRLSIAKHESELKQGLWTDTYEQVLMGLSDQELKEKHLEHKTPSYLGYRVKTKDYTHPSPLYLKIVREFFDRYPRVLEDMLVKNKPWLLNTYGQTGMDMAELFRVTYEKFIK